MGIFSKVAGILRYSETSGYSAGTFGTGVNLVSPFNSGYVLAPVLGMDDLGLPYGASATALDAYRVPAIAKGMALLTGTVANCRFTEADGTPVEGWLNNTPNAITPGMRLAALLADLILYREAVWFVTRDSTGVIDSAMHLPRDMWQLDPDGLVTIGGQTLPAQNVLYFQSLRPVGLLVAAEDAITGYHDMAAMIRSRARNPVPLVEIHTDETFNPDLYNLEEVRDRWAEARQAPNGAVAMTPPGVVVKTHEGAADSGWLVEARNAHRLDIANHLNLPAALLEGNSGASGTYENTLQSKDEYVSLSLAEWVLPIQERLSQPDALARPVRLDLSAYEVAAPVKGNTGNAVTTNERGINELES